MKIIATDMDGTLLNSRGDISDENKQAIEKAIANNIEVIVVTGRSYISAKRLLREKNLHTPIIGFNGGEVRSEEGKIIMNFPLNKELCSKIAAACSAEGVYYDIYTNEGVYSSSKEQTVESFVTLLARIHNQTPLEDIRKLVEQHMEDEQFHFTDQYEQVLHSNLTFYKMFALSLQEEQLQNVYHRLKGEEELVITSSGKGNLEFNHQDAKKGTVLQRYVNEKGISMNEVMAIGDNYNDVSMLQMAGRGVAMGNANEDIKEVCSHVTKTNDENGVAVAIEQLLNELNE
ncbi:Cof-type HAD-IIB family hydrolase [Salirhabdus salicampi]|uniref:Cof-type HAD-IIB family hydrolase n=1 Tax=Salirhabdus salicampi TaxID=476102 RepID=UPI0020C3E208|nr:Cof-type HAD-IIB family hydrolase [Salirhabdus salicampi]MCP8617183.1 Cof-type HAD-IIB family hydrolase [Salirhabdus salicampi]